MQICFLTLSGGSSFSLRRCLTANLRCPWTPACGGNRVVLLLTGSVFGCRVGRERHFCSASKTLASCSGKNLHLSIRLPIPGTGSQTVNREVSTGQAAAVNSCGRMKHKLVRLSVC